MSLWWGLELSHTVILFGALQINLTLIDMNTYKSKLIHTSVIIRLYTNKLNTSFPWDGNLPLLRPPLSISVKDAGSPLLYLPVASEYDDPAAAEFVQIDSSNEETYPTSPIGIYIGSGDRPDLLSHAHHAC